MEEIGLIKEGSLWDPKRGTNRQQTTFTPRMVGLSFGMDNIPPIDPEENATYNP